MVSLRLVMKLRISAAGHWNCNLQNGALLEVALLSKLRCFSVDGGYGP